MLSTKYVAPFVNLCVSHFSLYNHWSDSVEVIIAIINCQRHPQKKLYDGGTKKCVFAPTTNVWDVSWERDIKETLAWICRVKIREFRGVLYLWWQTTTNTEAFRASQCCKPVWAQAVRSERSNSFQSAALWRGGEVEVFLLYREPNEKGFYDTGIL